MMSCLSYFLIAVLLGLAVIFGSHSSPAEPATPNVTAVSASSLSACLPAGRKLTDVVSVSTGGANIVTVQQTLISLGAYCTTDHKLVDRTGKAIVFYQLIGCWGNPPQNYQALLKKQADEIAQLQQQYTVIQMTCNPRGLLIP
jgi:hypothetical protein